MQSEVSTVKGQCGKSRSKAGFEVNPQNINREGGPPRTHWWSELLIERAQAEDKMKKMKNKEVMADALIEKAKTGDIAAIKEFGDRVQGKAPQAIGSIGNDGEFEEQNINIRFVESKEKSV